MNELIVFGMSLVVAIIGYFILEKLRKIESIVTDIHDIQTKMEIHDYRIGVLEKKKE